VKRDLESRLEGLDDDVGGLVRETKEFMRRVDKDESAFDDFDWYDPLVQTYMDEHGVEYGVAQSRVVDTFLDAYLEFEDHFDDLTWEDEREMRDAVEWYSLCTAANYALPAEDADLAVYG